MDSQQQWTTADEIVAARERFIDAIDGWAAPSVHALVLVPSGEPVPAEHVALANVGGNLLPASVLATVVGWSHGTAVIEVTPEQLDRAIELLLPAEACTAFEHPNLHHWRDRILPAWRADHGARVVAVFVGESRPGQSASDDPSVLAVLAAAGRTS